MFQGKKECNDESSFCFRQKNMFVCLFVHLRAAQIVKEYATKGDKIIGCMSTLAATAT